MSTLSVVHTQAADWSPADQIAQAADLLTAKRPTPPPTPGPTAHVIKLIPRPSVPDQSAEVPSENQALNRAGRPRTTATMPGHRAGQAPASKGKRYPPDPVTPEDVNRMLRYLEQPRGRSENRHGEMSRLRLRALIAVLWRSGLRISEALDLDLRDLSYQELCITVRHGKGDKRRISAMDEWGWTELNRWLTMRSALPPGPVFCVLSGVTAGMRWSASDVRRQLKDTAKGAGVERRVAPHQFRHAHAVDLWRDDINVYVIQRQLGHARLDVTAQYLSGVAPVELLDPIGRRRAPLMPVAHSSGTGLKPRR